MKINNSLFLICTFLAINLNAQRYNLTVSTGTYQDLENSISLNQKWTWDDPGFAIPIGFDFKYFDYTLDTIHISSYGLGSYLTTTEEVDGILPFLIPYGSDIIDRGYDIIFGQSTLGSLSNISYLMEGDSGSRILKIEWNNVGFYNEIATNSSSSDYANFQLWLFEGSNNIEVHFGKSSVEFPDESFDGFPGPNVSLYSGINFDLLEITDVAYMVLGDPVSPKMTELSSLDDYFSLDSNIPNGTIYKFSYPSVDKSNVSTNANRITLFPNPVENKLNIKGIQQNEKLSQINILDIQGRIIKQYEIESNVIDVSDLNAGMYFIELISIDSKISKPFVKL